MLNLSQILEFYPENLHPFKSFILREYLQYHILEILFESQFAQEFCFIGGTALRIVHGNQRFSEDLDFDHINVDSKTFDKLAIVIESQLKKKGLVVEIRTVHKSAYHCYIKFPHILFNEKISSHANQKILIQLDSEAQYFEFEPELVFLNKFDIFCEIRSAPKDLLLAHKFSAVLGRPRNKGRDFFDIIFLLSMNIKPNYAYLKEKLGIENNHQLKTILLNKVARLSMEEMAKDVEPFLFQLHRRHLHSKFSKHISLNSCVSTHPFE
jgi:predicted nucleotidyltransferase component of viral defense system